MAKTKAKASPATTAVQFYKAAAAGKAEVRPVYAVVGPETYLRRQGVRAVKKLVEQAKGSAATLVRLHSDDTDQYKLRRECAARSLDRSPRVVVLDLSQGESWIKQERKREEIIRYCKAPEADATFVIEAPKLAKNLKVAKALAKVGIWVDCAPFKAPDLRKWLIKQADRRGLDMTARLADEMIALVGSDMTRLHSELVKLAVYVGESELSSGALRDVVCWTGDGGSFDLLDDLGRGDLTAALRSLQELLRNGDHPFRIMGLLQSRIRQHWKAAGAISDGVHPRSAARVAGVPPFAVAKFLEAHRGLTLAKCRRLHDLLLEADRKVSSMTPEARLRLFVMDGCRIFRGQEGDR